MPWIRRWTRPSPCDDDGGYTLIEVVVALGVLATVMLPLASTFVWGATADASNRENGDAIAIADGFLANAESITYANLGFYEGQFSNHVVPGYDGQPGVDLGATPPAGVTEQVPAQSQPQQVGSIIYNEQTYITWVNGSAPTPSTTVPSSTSTTVAPSTTTTTTAPYSFAYKQVYAVVSWDEHGHTTQVDQSILVYPGGLGSYTGPEDNTPSGTTGSPDNVAGLTASVPTTSAGETEVQLSWTPPQDPTGFYAAVWSTDQSDLATPSTSGTDGSWAPTGTTTSGTILGSATSYTANGLQPDTQYWFEIVAFSSDGVEWAVSQSWVTATTLSAPIPCSLNTLTVSQSGQLSGQAGVANGNGRLIQPITMTVTYSGSCTSSTDTVKVSATSNGNDPGSPYALTWSATGYAYTLCPSSGFTTGTHTYTATDNGVTTSLNAQVAFSTNKKTQPAC